MQMGEAMHAESPVYRDLPFDAQKVGAWAAMHMRRPDMGAWGAHTSEGELAGVLFASLSDVFFGSAVIAREDTFYVSPEHRGNGAAFDLVHRFLVWGQEKGAARAVITASTGVDDAKVTRFLSKVGFQPAGTAMRFDYGRPDAELQSA